MNVIKFRISEDDLTGLEIAAGGMDLSRSAYIKYCIALKGEPSRAAKEMRPVRPKGRDKKRISVSFNDRELSAISQAATAIGMSKTDFLRSLVRSNLWDGEGGVIMTPAVKKELAGLVGNFRAIGNNINQAVKMIHIAAVPNSNVDLKKSVDNLADLADQALTELKKYDGQITALLSEENRYWRGASILQQGDVQ